MRRWLVAVDDSEFALYAFNYVLASMHEDDFLYLMNVSDEPARFFVGYANPSLLDTLRRVEDEKSRKILVHYGHRAQQAGVC